MPRVPPVTTATRAILSSLGRTGLACADRSHDWYFLTKTAERESTRSAVESTGASALDAHGNAHAAADAQGREALLGIALLHLVQQGHEHARAGCTDRVTDRDGAAVDVDL